MPISRSFLFVPGNRADRFNKAARSGAHEIILDLEDAVEPVRKREARTAIGSWDGRTEAAIRINAAETDWFAADLAFVTQAGIKKIMVPKAEPAVLKAVASALGANIEIIALIETVAGFMRLREIGQAGLAERLAFGNLDFGLDAGISDGSGELDAVRLQIVLESRFANLPPPIDGVSVAFSDPALVAAHVARAKALGFGGKLCIHPAQLGPVNAGFSPSIDEIAWARRILAAVDGRGDGAISVDGKMVDHPVAERARAIIAAQTQLNTEE